MKLPKELPSRLRMTAIVAGILLVGFLAANTLSFFASRESIRNSVLENELPLISDNIYSAIQGDLLVPAFIAGLMANDTFLKDWILSGESDPARAVRYLDNIRGNYGVFTAFFISEQTRNYYHFSGITRQVTDPVLDAWYFRVRDMAEPFEINVDFNREQGNALTVFVDQKVLDYNGKFLGVTGVGLNFNAVTDAISHYEKEFGRGLYFVDRAGMIKVRSADAAIREDDITAAPGVKDIAEDIMADKKGAFTYEHNGETYLLSSRFVPEIGWHVIVEQREADRVGAIRQSFLISTLVGLGITLVLVVIIGFAIRQYEGQLNLLAVTDRLTGIGNRRAFDVSLEQALRRTPREKIPFSVILFDIDHFKQINDSYGHIAGDKVINDVTQVISGRIRDADIFCRWGGEEFIVLAYNCAEPAAQELAEKIRAAVYDAKVILHSSGAPLTVSAGVTAYHDGDDSNSILGRADSALYTAKAEGRNKVVIR